MKWLTVALHKPAGCLLLFLFWTISPVICIRTFYDADLPTSHFFKGQTNELNYCDELGWFYGNKSELTSMTKCIRFKPSQLLYCHGDIDEYQNYSNKGKLERIESLVICRHTQPSFDTNNLKNFLKLKNLYIGVGMLQRFSDKMPKLENLEYINITRTQLQTIKSDFFYDLPSIQLIDLRYNRMFVLDRFVFHSNNSDVRVFLYHNLWDCTKNLKWMATSDSRFQIVDRNVLNCSDTKYRARPLLVVMTTKVALYKSCREEISDLRNCSCHISFFRLQHEGNEWQPMFSVNCSGVGFTNFPSRLPENTTTLFITHNKINSLNMLCTRNSTYNKVHDIFLDHNLIADASVLDNCEWFLNFRVLSLKGNLLEKIPNYAFRNSFEKSQHAIKLYLSGNPWLCNCRLQPRLLKLCKKYDLIADQKQMRCLSENNDPDIYGRYLLELSKTDVCKIDKFPLNPFEILSIIFALLIVLCWAVLLYDYYLYRNYGKLPWIVLHSRIF